MTAPQGAGLVLEVGREYVTRSGLTVKITEDVGRPDYPMRGFYLASGANRWWNRDGSFVGDKQCERDLISLARPAAEAVVPADVVEALAVLDKATQFSGSTIVLYDHEVAAYKTLRNFLRTQGVAP